jgi:FAD/FMN-containing dehydrogenase
VLAAEIVTAQGEVLQVDETQHPDLFWALRGGGGNFGVVTKFKYALHEVKEAYGGMLFLPAAPEVLAGYMALAERAPRELSSILNIMPAFPMPFIPKEHHGKLCIMAMMMCVGDIAFAEETLKPFRELATPLADQLKPMRYAEMFPPQGEEYHPMAVSQTMFMKSVDQAMATTIIEELNKFDAPMRAVQLRVLGGAVEDVPVDATAYAHRKNKIMVNVATFYETPEQKPQRTEWINYMVKTLDQGDNAVYVNFLGATDEHRLHDAYPGQTLEKLIEVKKKYDPENFFRKCLPLLSA